MAFHSPSPAAIKSAVLRVPTPKVTKRWQDVPLPDRFYYFVSAMNEVGTARVFTIHPTYASRRQMQKSQLSVREFYSQRLRSFLSGHSAFFVVEVSPRGMVHIHGLIDSRGYTDREMLHQLKKVAGDKRKLVAGADKYFYGRHAVHCRAPDWSACYHVASDWTGPYGWALYCTKDIRRTMKALSVHSAEELIYVSNDVRRLARKLHRKDVDQARDR